jgi:hypothetical protein
LDVEEAEVVSVQQEPGLRALVVVAFSRLGHLFQNVVAFVSVFVLLELHGGCPQVVLLESPLIYL